MSESNTSETGRGAIALWLATSVGVPGTLISIFKDDVRHHPWGAVLVVGLWGILALVGGILIGVWKREQRVIEDRLSGAIALGRRLTRYRRRYLDWVFYQHRDFDVKGLSTQGIYNLELEQVFVDLSIAAKPAHETSRSILRVPQNSKERHQIWDYLRDEKINEQDLVLIGTPGSGKTTLLKKVALQMTGRQRPKIRQNIPILLFLRDHAESIAANPSFKLVQALSDMFSRKEGPLPPEGWFEAQLKDGKCLILLDGLDEVAAPEIRKEVVDWVERQIRGHAKNRFIISSRPHGYLNNPIVGVTVLEVQPFTRPQVREFVARWYRANEIMASRKIDPGVEMKARAGASDLFRRLGKSQTLTDLAVNPLLLTMIATIHRYKSSLPGRRVELYAEICEVFLGKRKASGIESNLTPAQKQVVLQPLAYHLMLTKRREIEMAEALGTISDTLLKVSGVAGEKEGEAFLKEIEDRSGLLQQREVGVFSFAHLAFQEYLASVHIKERGMVDKLTESIDNPWWHEVIRLYGAQGDASPIIAKCLALERPSVGALSLAIDCLEEAQKVDISLRQRLNELVLMGAEDGDADRSGLAAETILTRRVQGMVSVDDNISVDSDYVSHAEYQLFIDSSPTNHVPDHWSQGRFVKGSAHTPLVGLRRSDAKEFCEWLGSKYDNFSFRLPEFGELAKMGIDTPQQSVCQAYWTSKPSGAGPYFELITESTERISSKYAEWLILGDFLGSDRDGQIKKIERENQIRIKPEKGPERFDTDEDIKRAIELFSEEEGIRLDVARPYAGPRFNFEHFQLPD